MKYSEIFIFSLGIIFGFLFPSFASSIQKWLLPALIIMMSVSLRKLKFTGVNDKSSIVKLVLLNYGALSIILMFGARILIKNKAYIEGIDILALMPPAIGIISLIYLLDGDIKRGFFSETTGYLISIIIIPLGAFIIFKQDINLSYLIVLIGKVIILPLIISRVIVWLEKKGHKKRYYIKENIMRYIILICYALTFFIVIGINKDLILNDLKSVMLLFVLLFIATFVWGTSIYLFSKDKVLDVLFGTLKNGGAATVIALMMFGPAQTLPHAVNSILTPFYIIYLEWLMGK